MHRGPGSGRAALSDSMRRELEDRRAELLEPQTFRGYQAAGVGKSADIPKNNLGLHRRLSLGTIEGRRYGTCHVLRKNISSCFTEHVILHARLGDAREILFRISSCTTRLVRHMRQLVRKRPYRFPRMPDTSRCVSEMHLHFDIFQPGNIPAPAHASMPRAMEGYLYVRHRDVGKICGKNRNRGSKVSGQLAPVIASRDPHCAYPHLAGVAVCKVRTGQDRGETIKRNPAHRAETHRVSAVIGHQTGQSSEPGRRAGRQKRSCHQQRQRQFRAPLTGSGSTRNHHTHRAHHHPSLRNQTPSQHRRTAQRYS